MRGTRLGDLKAAIARAEDRYYERYNELNDKDEFDIDERPFGGIPDAELPMSIPKEVTL